MNRATYRTGFTAIEMVSAITILMLIMAAVATIFSKSNDLWAHSVGGDRLTRSTRRALDLMVRDMRHAVVEDELPFVLGESGTNDLSGVEMGDLILATHRDDGNPTNRAIDLVWYGLRKVEEADDDGPPRIDLVRGVHAITNAADDQIFADDETGVLVENVTFFRLEATRPDGGLATLYDAHLAESVGSGAGTNTAADIRRAIEGRLPRRVDIVIEAISPRIAWQLTRMDEAEQQELIDRKSIRLTAAASFVTGYSAERGR